MSVEIAPLIIHNPTHSTWENYPLVYTGTTWCTHFCSVLLGERPSGEGSGWTWKEPSGSMYLEGDALAMVQN